MLFSVAPLMSSIGALAWGVSEGHWPSVGIILGVALNTSEVSVAGDELRELN